MAAKDIIVWLIEWPEDDNMPVRWWHPVGGWMRDAYKACWFVRKEDAEAFQKHQRLSGIVTQHTFLET